MAAHVTAVLADTVDEVVAVSSADLDLPPLPARVVHDRDPFLGPLAGIREGLAAVGGELAYVTAVDAPFLTPASIATLLAHGGAAAPVAEGHVQTLAAVYPAAGAAVAAELLAAGERRPLALLEALDYSPVAAAELPAEAWRGFNTPLEYVAAVRREHGDAARARLELTGTARAAAGIAELEVPVGTLGDVLGALSPRLPAGVVLTAGGRVAEPFIASIEGRDLVRDLRIPIGPGERVLILDAQAGG